jgi:hypothetical protein
MNDANVTTGAFFTTGKYLTASGKRPVQKGGQYALWLF